MSWPLFRLFWGGSLLLACLPTAICAAPPAPAESDALSTARRDLEVAQLRARIYERMEAPLLARRLDHQIELATLQVDLLKRRLKEYEPLTRFTHSSPLLITLEESRLNLLEAELRLDQLKEERLLRMRYHGDLLRLHELTAGSALQRVRQLGGR